MRRSIGNIIGYPQVFVSKNEKSHVLAFFNRNFCFFVKIRGSVYGTGSTMTKTKHLLDGGERSRSCRTKPKITKNTFLQRNFHFRVILA